MKLVPASLGGRLLLAATVFIAAALIAAGGLAWLVLDRFVHGQVDLQLDGEIATIAAALEPTADGRIVVGHDVDGGFFAAPFSGWYWQVRDGAATLRSPSLAGTDLPIPTLRGPDSPGSNLRPAAADEPGPRNQPLHLRVESLAFGPRTVTIVAAAPEAALSGPLGEAMTAVALALGLAGIGLVFAMLVQVRLGLRPLNRLRLAVAEVRAGRALRVSPDQPSEVAPLVAELNSLIVENAEGLARARRHVANLAHGLKTPLASLAVALEAPGRDPGGDLTGLVRLMDRRIRHHLGRARAAALAGAARAHTALAPRIADLLAAVPKIYADRRIAVATHLEPELVVACEPQDLDEMLGNVLDNAFKWAAGKVRVAARREESEIVVVIEDDGPGLPEDKVPEALRPGRRLDESAPGYGFGLPITRELAELYGGGMDLGRSALGGLSVSVRLPAAA